MWHDGAFLQGAKAFHFARANRESGVWDAIWRRRRVAAVCALVALGTTLCGLEVRSSWVESNVLPAVARRETFALRPGRSDTLAIAPRGPYDQRLGMAELPVLIHHLEAHGFGIQAQARDSRTAFLLSSFGIGPVYREKDQAGLTILDQQGRPLYASLYPHRLYSNFHSIPPLVIQTLLYIENRQLLDVAHPRRNPAIQWGRLSRAFADLAIHTVDRGHPLIGGSTLPTQLTKIRHSPEGRTGSLMDKARQVVSASLRSYEGGPNTVHAQQEIVCDYINSIPLAATRDEGEVIGLADGLRDWYGADPDVVSRLLFSAASTGPHGASIGPHGVTNAQARAYRETLSLLLALHAPTRELVAHPDALRLRTDRYLRALAKDGVISVPLRDRALRVHLKLRPAGPGEPSASFVANKAPNAIRSALLPQLGVGSYYALDRLDLTVRTSLDQRAQESITKFLNGLWDAKAVQAAGLVGHQLLEGGKQAPVIYSVTLYERAAGANVLRVQTDNYNQPLDINEGTRLQLGSTAKLRTLIDYLQIIEQLHQRYAGETASQLQQEKPIPGDELTKWAITYLATAKERGVEEMLRAALSRKYSGNPGEAFFTAGGLHHFANFDPSENSRVFTVADAFQNSVNLAFIRLMRDIERYYMFRMPGASPSVLDDPSDPARRGYLDRFADFEGRTFLTRFYAKYEGQTADRALQTLVAGVRMTPLRAAVIFRSVRPDASLAQFSEFLNARFPHPAAKIDAAELYAKYGPDKFDLNDRGYLAHVHPLELWLLNYRRRHPSAGLAEVLNSSAAQRQEVYQWLLKTRYRHAQDKRIETLLEIDAFRAIHRDWARLGYPFDSLTPSYATCIGVSGDTPQALADLVGIIVNGGIRYPTVRIEQLHFFEGTPFDTVMAPRLRGSERLLSPVIAKLVREQMIGVVQNGTGRRASGGMRLADGTLLAIGGKTGTGDNRLEEFNARGGLIGDKVVNRTAAFVFFAGDRFYGTILAFVPGQKASGYSFTSALAVQLLKDLEPRLERLASGSRRNFAGGT